MFRSIIFNILFYIGSIIILVTFSPLVWVSWVAFYVAYGWAGWFLWLSRVVMGIKYEIHGQAYISKDKPVLYASKHQSAWETLAFYYLLRGPSFVIKRELGWVPFLGLYSLGTKMIFLNRKGGMQSFKKMIHDAKNRFSQGRSIVIFPEGTRTAVGERGGYKSGIYPIYKALNCHVVPVALNSGICWPRKSFQKYPGTISIEFLSPIEPGLGKEEFMKVLEEKIETACQKL